MAIHPNALISKFEQAYQNKWGYIWGQAGAVWTEAKQRALVNKYNSNPIKYSDYKQGATYGKKWIGHQVADCSGLFKRAFEDLGGTMYHGSNTMYNKWCTAKGSLKKGARTDGKVLLPGTAVFTGTEKNRGHVGLYIGDGWVIEAQGTIAGVVKSKITLAKWTWWGELKGVDYEASESVIETPVATKGSSKTTKTTKKSYPTLRRGAKGNDVKEMQKLLHNYGSSLEVDGIFGAGTMSAVMAFQKKHNLVVDGICGPKTWAKLLAYA